MNNDNKPTVITGDAIPLFRLKVLIQGLRLEIRGMRLTRGRSCYSVVKAQFGFKGTKEHVLSQLITYSDILHRQAGHDV